MILFSLSVRRAPSSAVRPAGVGCGVRRSAAGEASDFDFDLDTRGQFQFHQCVDGLGRRRIDVQNTLEGAELELLAGSLVDESRAVDRENLLVRGQRHRAADNGARALDSLHNLLGRFVDQIVIERL